MADKNEKLVKASNILQTVYRSYDAENDIIPGAPMVTSTDFLLAGLIATLMIVIDDLEKEIKSLKDEKCPSQP